MAAVGLAKEPDFLLCVERTNQYRLAIGIQSRLEPAAGQGHQLGEEAVRISNSRPVRRIVQGCSDDQRVTRSHPIHERQQLISPRRLAVGRRRQEHVTGAGQLRGKRVVSQAQAVHWYVSRLQPLHQAQVAVSTVLRGRGPGDR